MEKDEKKSDISNTSSSLNETNHFYPANEHEMTDATDIQKCITAEEFTDIKKRCERILKSPISNPRTEALEIEFASLVQKFKSCYALYLSYNYQIEKNISEIEKKYEEIKHLNQSLNEFKASSKLTKKSKKIKGAKRKKLKRKGLKKKKLKRKGLKKKKLKRKGLQKKKLKRKGLQKKKLKRKAMKKKKLSVKRKKLKSRKKKVKKIKKRKDKKTKVKPKSLNKPKRGLSKKKETKIKSPLKFTTQVIFLSSCEQYDCLLDLPKSEQKEKAIEMELPSLLNKLETLITLLYETKNKAEEVQSYLKTKESTIQNLSRKLDIAERSYELMEMEKIYPDVVENTDITKKKKSKSKKQTRRGKKKKKAHPAKKKGPVKKKARRGKKKGARHIKKKKRLTAKKKEKLSKKGKASKETRKAGQLKTKKYAKTDQDSSSWETVSKLYQIPSNAQLLTSFHNRVMELFHTDQKMINDAKFAAIDEYCDRILSNPPSLERNMRMEAQFRLLLESFRTCYATQRSLIYKVKELQAEIGVKNAIVASLKSEKIRLKESRIEIDSTLEEVRERRLELVLKEKQMRRKLQGAEKELADIRNEIQGSSKQSRPCDVTLYREMEEKLIHERDVLQNVVNEISKEKEKVEEDCRKFRVEAEEISCEAQDLKQKLMKTRKKYKMEILKQKRMSNKKLESVKHTLKQKTKELESLRMDFETTRQSLEESITKSKKFQNNYYKIMESYSNLKQLYNKTRKNLDVSKANALSLKSEKDDLVAALEARSEEIHRMKIRIVKFIKNGTSLAKKIRLMRNELLQTKRSHETLENEKKNMSNKITRLEEEKSELSDNLKHALAQENHLLKSLARSEGLYRKLSERVTTENTNKDSLTQQSTATCENTNCHKQIHKMEMNEKSMMKKIYNLTVHCKSLDDRNRHEIKTNLNQLQKIDELQNRVFEGERLLREMKYELNMSEVRTVKAQEARTNLHAEVIRLQKIVEGFKIRPSDKEDLYKDMQERLKKLLKERFALMRAIEEKTKIAQLAKSEVSGISSQIHAISLELKPQLVKTKKQLYMLTDENNFQKSVLKRQSEKINLLKDKISILHRVLTRGECEYQNRVSDITIMKREIETLARNNGVLTNQLSCYKQARIELVKLQKELTKEKVNVQALKNELQQPVNIHRWRHLEGSDPDRYELLLKSQNLQKKLINAMITIDKRNHELNESKKVIDKLKQMLNCKPSKDIFNHVRKYKTQYEKEREKVTSLSAQINMYEMLHSNQKNQLKTLREQIIELKNETWLKNIKNRNKS